jgi:hypothetical protein
VTRWQPVGSDQKRSPFELFSARGSVNRAGDMPNARSLLSGPFTASPHGKPASNIASPQHPPPRIALCGLLGTTQASVGALGLLLTPTGSSNSAFLDHDY